MAARRSRDLTAEITTFGARNGIPDLAAAVVDSAGSSVAVVGTANPLSTEVGFCIGSISKTLTASCVLRMRDDGILGLDEPLDRYLPEVREIGRWASWGSAVTLRALLQHSAGLPCDAPSSDLHLWEPLPVDAVLRDPAQVDIVIPPGTQFKYSNLGYELLGEVVARASGQTYGEVVRRRLLEPLAMDRTWLGPVPPEGPSPALGHGPLADGVRNPAAPPLRSDCASGGWWSTASDMATWVRFHLEQDRPDILARTTLAEMHAPAIATSGGGSYGLGWRTYAHGSGTATGGHGGLTSGFEARIELDPNQQVGAVALMAAVGPNDPTERLVSWLLGRAPTPHRRTGPEPPRAAACAPREDPTQVAGRYREVGFEWTVSVTESPDGLVLRDDDECWVLTPTGSPDRYLVPGGRCAGEHLVVLRDRRGTVEAINVAGYPLTPVTD